MCLPRAQESGALLLAMLFAAPGACLVPASAGVPDGPDVTQASFVRFAPVPAGQDGYARAYPEIYVEGSIDETTFGQLRSIVDLNQLQSAKVQFNSTGGDLLAAIEIGYYLREKAFMTEVGAFDGGWGRFAVGECHSACAVAYLGGKYRFMDAGSRMAVHRFATDRDEDESSLRDVEQETQALAGLLVAYIQQMGVDVAFFKRMTERPHEDLAYLGMDELRRMNVVNDGRSAPSWTLAIRDGRVVLVGRQERLDNGGTVEFRCAAPIEVSFAMARYAEAWKDAAGSLRLQWVLGHERFDVSPGMLAGPVSTAEGRFGVDIRLDESQARRLPAAPGIGLAVQHDGRRYEFEVDTGSGRDSIRQFLDFCRTHAAAH
jgi:hypothetical protein